MRNSEFCIPIQGAMRVENYSVTLLDVSRRWWDNYFGLKPLGTLFSVLKILGKSASLAMEVWRSWEFLCIRVALYMYVWVIRSKNLIRKSMNWWRDIWFLWHKFSIFFKHICSQSYPITFDSFLTWFARNLGDILCTKRFRKLGLVFSTYLF